MTRCAVLFASFVCTALIAIAQTPATIKTSVRLIQFPVSVTSKHGRSPAALLASNNFRVSVNGQPREVSSILQGSDLPPLKLVFLIESADAQSNAVQGLIDALPPATAALPAGDQVGIATVFPGFKLVQEPTTDRNTLRPALQRVRDEQRARLTGKTKSGSTSFDFNDVSRALASISKLQSEPADQARLVIVLVSDDFDLLNPQLAVSTSHQLWQDNTTVCAFIDSQNPGVAIAKNMVHGMWTVTPMRLGVQDRGASWFANQTGGPMIAIHGEDYPHALQELLEGIRSTYLIGFRPAPPDLDGKPHKLTVTLRPSSLRKDVAIRNKAGFVAQP